MRRMGDNPKYAKEYDLPYEDAVGEAVRRIFELIAGVFLDEK